MASMSEPAFTLHVPVDSAFRELAAAVVGRYVELVGGSPAERDHVTAALARAIDGLAGRPGEAIDLECTQGASGVDVAVRCGDRSAAVHHPGPAARR